VDQGGSSILIMIIADAKLRSLFTSLDVESQRALALHICLGRPSDESRAALRRIKASLKRRARAKLPARFKWLA
jgi:hypothetical protein